MRIAVTGANGLIGSRFIELLNEKFEILGISSSLGINILDRALLFQKLIEFSPSVIVHFAAKTDVDGCEEDATYDLNKLKDLHVYENDSFITQNIHPEDWQNDATAFAVNVVGTKNIADFAQEHNTRVALISTDFVYKGDKYFYSEDDTPFPINWYGMTKFLGEQVLTLQNSNFFIARIAYPFGNSPSGRRDFVTKMYDLLACGKKISLVTDHFMTPTHIDDVVNGVKFLIDQKVSGVYHVVGESFVTPMEVGNLLADTFSFEKTHISSITREEFFKDRAARPFQLRLQNDKLEQLGFKAASFEESLRKMKFG